MRSYIVFLSVIGSFFFAATRPTHSQGFGFSRLACRERSERNAKREKTYIFFAGGTDAKNQQSISEGNTAYSLFTGGTEVNNQQSISEGNTAYSLFTGGTEVNNQTIHFRRKYLTLFIID